MASILLLSRGYQFWSCFILIVLIVGTVYILNDNQHFSSSLKALRSHSNSGLKYDQSSSQTTSMPEILWKKHIYSSSDFINERGIIPTFWNESVTCQMDRNKIPLTNHCRPVWGPCFPPSSDQWSSRMISKYNSEETYIKGESTATMKKNQDDWDNQCRPGFLIIGQGKCGTSSLYHYLAQHPRVLLASEKQIHYFKYYEARGMRWYLSHFPTTQSMLSMGGLMTGEASPGYLPYPDVAHRVQGELPGARIICLGRHPLDRSYSSYRYNYIHPALTQLKRGKVPGVERGQTDEYYIQHHLYSFEDMIRAELDQLKNCLAPGGPGEVGAAEAYANKGWARPLYERRSAAGLPPLVDLDANCYGDFINATVPKEQWTDLVRRKPGKYLNVPNLHLSQAMIGRSLYVYPLEWWYELFAPEDLYFLCTEEMKNLTGAPVNEVAQFLGLPSHDFAPIVSAGAYNVGGHKGYDKVTSWENIQEADESTEQQVLLLDQSMEENTNSSSTNTTTTTEDEGENSIPLSDELKTELMDFLQIHNERLFQLIGRRCTWD